MSRLTWVRVCRVPQGIAEEVDAQNREHHNERGKHTPRVHGDGSNILCLLKHLAPHCPCESCPPEDRENYRNYQLDSEGRPLGEDGRGKGHPKGYGRDPVQELDQSLNKHVDSPAEVSGNSSQDRAQIKLMMTPNNPIDRDTREPCRTRE